MFARSVPLPLVGTQLALVGLAFGALALSPPASGKMMLVPLWPGAERGMLAQAVARGATLVAPGPLPSTYVVAGRREMLSGFATVGVLVIAAPARGCGAGAPRAA